MVADGRAKSNSGSSIRWATLVFAMLLAANLLAELLVLPVYEHATHRSSFAGALGWYAGRGSQLIEGILLLVFSLLLLANRRKAAS